MENPAQPETYRDLLTCKGYKKSTSQLPWDIVKSILDSSLTEAQKTKLLAALFMSNMFGTYPSSLYLPPTALDRYNDHLPRVNHMRKKSLERRVGEVRKKRRNGEALSEIDSEFLERNPDIMDSLPADSPSSTAQSSPTESDNQNQTETPTDRDPTNTNHPMRDEVRSFGFGEGLALDPDSFFDSMEGRGWKDRDGNPVNSWKGLYRSWAKRMGEPAPPKAGKPEETASALTMELPDGTFLLNGRHMRKNGIGTLEPMEEPWEGEDTSGLWIGPDDIPSFPWEGEELPSFPWDDEDIPF